MQAHNWKLCPSFHVVLYSDIEGYYFYHYHYGVYYFYFLQKSRRGGNNPVPFTIGILNALLKPHQVNDTFVCVLEFIQA